MAKIKPLDLKNIDWPEILSRTSQYATSEMARERLAEIQPLAHADEAMKCFRISEELRVVLNQGERPFMESLDLFSTWVQRLKKSAVLTTLQLKDVRHFCLEIVSLREVLKDFETSWVAAAKKFLMEAEYPLAAIDQLMTPAGEIRTDASERLFQLYNEKNQQAKSVQNILDRIVKAQNLEHILQDRYYTIREGRMVLPIKSGMRHDFPGLIHATSTTKQTVFMEPEEVIPLNNRLKQIDSEIEGEIERLLQQVSAYLTSIIDQFFTSSEWLLEFDYRFALAQMAQFLNANSVNFAKDKIDLRDVRHPLLVLAGQSVVPNNLKLSRDERILLLSGPNAGGKTVLLKSVGLAAHMARCGMQVCAAEETTLPFFKNLYVAVGDSQSVDEQLSTFAAHLKILHLATQGRGSDDLLLIDEIAGSTDPEEGTALARAFIEDYATNGPFGVITSHLGPLKLGWEPESGVVNGSMEYSMQTGRATYHFVMGVPGQSLAIRTAEKVGVSPHILQKAFSFLSPESKNHQRAIKEIETLRDQLEKARENLNAELAETRETKNRYHHLLEQFRKEKHDRLERAVKKAEQKIDGFIERAKVDDIFKRHERLEKIKHEIPELIKTAPSSPGIETAEQFEKAYQPGSKVFVPHLNQDGIIQGKANQKGEIPVLVNSMRLFVPWQQLRPPQRALNPTSHAVRRATGVTVSLTDAERVIDLRGFTIEKAVSELEIQLDMASTNHEDRVKVIHGHGTEALKKAVRGYLSRSLYVKKWTAGTPESGGDGMTWAEIGDA